MATTRSALKRREALDGYLFIAPWLIGFVVFVPFLVIDVVVSSALMSMGMMMLPPALISLPFKLLLFVMVSGWSMIATALVQSYH